RTLPRSATRLSSRSSRRHAVSPQPAPSEGGFVRHVVTFGRILREAGLEVGPGRISDALTGLDCLDIRNRDDVYWALRTTLVSRAEDLDSFDRAFAACSCVHPRLRRTEERLRPTVRRASPHGRARIGQGETASPATRPRRSAGA